MTEDNAAEAKVNTWRDEAVAILIIYAVPIAFIFTLALIFSAAAGLDNFWPNLALNLGTGLLGAIVTIVVLERLLGSQWHVDNDNQTRTRDGAPVRPPSAPGAKQRARMDNHLRVRLFRYALMLVLAGALGLLLVVASTLHEFRANLALNLATDLLGAIATILFLESLLTKWLVLAPKGTTVRFSLASRIAARTVPLWALPLGTALRRIEKKSRPLIARLLPWLDREFPDDRIPLLTPFAEWLLREGHVQVMDGDLDYGPQVQRLLQLSQRLLRDLQPETAAFLDAAMASLANPPATQPLQQAATDSNEAPPVYARVSGTHTTNGVIHAHH